MRLCAFSPGIATHEAPSALQRLHWYAYEVGELAHWPRSVVSVWPTRAVPVIAGSCVMAGATAG
jgi:hypothetical protein